MASTFSIISTVFFTTGVLFIMQAVALVVLYAVKWRNGRLGASRGEDHANMMILFQSMRDLLHEQKQLARQLNEDIDRKLTRINLVVHDALDNVQRQGVQRQGPRHAPSRPASPPESARTQADRDAREVFLREARKLSTHTPPVSGPSEAAPRKSEQVEPAPRPKPADTPEGFRAVAEDAQDAGPTGERFDAWVGLDFVDDAPNPYRVEVPEQPPAEPGDAEKARAAFRSLLDMHQDADAAANSPTADPPRPSAQARGIGAPPTPPSSAQGATNGERKSTPLQRRVQEYADAGMSVPQIARELGIGKGEVRLILSLREGRKV